MYINEMASNAVIDNHEEPLSTATTFRFASGELLTIDQNQIDKIPYVSAIVSSTGRFELARDDEGYLKLDPWINYDDFKFILKLTSFTSIRQLFTHLPKEINAIPIIALWNFLGLDSQCSPTLKEVYQTFFSTVTYNPTNGNYTRIIKPPAIQEMAVRFAIGIVKEEYDFTSDDVIDHIYWLVMFILSAYKFFGTRLRHHVHMIVENCFNIFKPSQLKPLNRLKMKMDYDARKRHASRYYYIYDTYKVPNFLHSNEISFDYYGANENYIYSRRWFHDMFVDYCIQKKFLNTGSYFISCIPKKEPLLKPVYKNVLETMYCRLQDQIYHHMISYLNDKHNRKRAKPDSWFSFSTLFDSESLELPSTIKELFKSELVKKEIRELILEQLHILVPKLKQKHIELVREHQSYDSNPLNAYLSYQRLRWSLSYLPFESLENQILQHTQLLDKLDHPSNIVIEQMESCVYELLCIAVSNQLNSWDETENEINELRNFLAPELNINDMLHSIPKSAYQRYQTSPAKAVPKCQLKYGKR